MACRQAQQEEEGRWNKTRRRLLAIIMTAAMLAGSVDTTIFAANGASGQANPSAADAADVLAPQAVIPDIVAEWPDTYETVASQEDAADLRTQDGDTNVLVLADESSVSGIKFGEIAAAGNAALVLSDDIDTAIVSVYKEQTEIVVFPDDMEFVLWDDVLDYTPAVSVSDTESEADESMAEDLSGDGAGDSGISDAAGGGDGTSDDSSLAAEAPAQDAAAGNLSYATPLGSLVYPAAWDEVIGVAGADRSADGGIVSSTWYLHSGAVFVSADGSCKGEKGSSFAAPRVTAALAEHMAEMPAEETDGKKRREDAEAYLKSIAEDAGSPGYDTVFGWGFIE